MSVPSTALPTPAAGLREQALVWWRSRVVRERQALVLVAVVLVLFVVWTLAVQPAWRTVRAAPAQLDRLDAQLQQMQRIAAESQLLRATAPVSAAQAALALKSATERLGSGGRLVQQGDRATLTLSNVSPEALRAWLTEARSGARARPVEAQLQRSPGGYNGSLSVVLGSDA